MELLVNTTNNNCRADNENVRRDSNTIRLDTSLTFDGRGDYRSKSWSSGKHFPLSQVPVPLIINYLRLILHEICLALR